MTNIFIFFTFFKRFPQCYSFHHTISLFGATIITFASLFFITRSGHILARWLPRMLKLQGRFPEAALIHTICTRRSAGTQVLPIRVGVATSQLDLPSLSPLSVAGRGRLQLGVPHWATSVDYCK